MRLAAVVVHYRNWPGVSETLRSIEGQSHPPDVRIVVDSCSTDGSPDEIAQAHPSWEVVRLDRNAGYAAAVNAALALPSVHQADRVLVCTHEVILHAGATQALMDAIASGPDVGAAGPVLWRRSDGSLWSAGGGLGRRTARPWHRQATPDPHSGPLPVEWVDGAVVLYPMAALTGVGRLDEGYFLYYEELDYQCRMRRAGWRIVVVPEARAEQEPGMVPPYLEARNRVRWLRRTRRWGPLLFAVVEQVATAAMALTSPDRRWESGARLRGLTHGFTGRLDHDLAMRRSPARRASASSC